MTVRKYMSTQYQRRVSWLPRHTQKPSLPRALITNSSPRNTTHHLHLSINLASHLIRRTFTFTAIRMGVKKTVIKEGSGASPNKGDTVTMLYTGWLRTPGQPEEKGKEFDSTQKPGRGPFQTPIGVSRVIKGWDEGVPTMKVGEKARLDISSDYAYGSQEFPGLIPPHSDLIFEVELVKIN
ncbi:hypothetical protein EJ05DRAFT_471564 [Pseudovirgaria hyperparasitica]|uniref:peptidylprolyl isomerase n=1 Tax=Pseudovirgaria hyperparasitica TaxID=470096 RepID=A0A6A6WK85_9PEZI|nr:uncharacterized protein EJ05DRAFT_471564 [Pseudovirgaria hyperparasitica]KAF2762575.1 hypothetical protein EJ05DRAFT_471564 [Pseudovirgaria hyperparasitica]